MPESGRPTYRIEGAIGDGDATAAALAGFLGEHPGEEVDVIVNSPGGLATEGAAILAEAEAHGRVRFRVRGIAASSASLLLCGGQTVLIHPAALWMAHSPWAITAGDATTHRATADVLDVVEHSDVAAYSRFSGQPAARVADWLKDELWLSAEETVALNFADAVDDEADSEPPAPADYTSFAAAPQNLRRLARESGWATTSPDLPAKEAVS